MDEWAARSSHEVVGPLGEELDRASPEAAHLEDDTPGEALGTRNAKKAIVRGESYQPPDGPIQEGIWSRENH